MTFDVKFTESQSFNTEFETPTQPLDADFENLQIVDTGTIIAPLPRIVDVSILADAWVGTSSPYSQVVTVEGATPCSQVDLTPSVEHLTAFYEKDLAFVTENEDGVVTVYAIGQKPMNDYIMQVTVTEVDV
jgi:hypothetical protein